MALKKSQLYSKLWQSCDELRGGMDASQYKDYVLTLLFVKYVSDKYAADPAALIEVPPGARFADMVAAKGDKEIGDRINKIIGKLAEANDSLKGAINVADFNDEEKLGKGKEMVDRLSKLVAIFEGLDFGRNRAEGDDLLGDAYEYLMRHFATESGKSKGQFYTPAEVSRVMAQVIGLDKATSATQTIYDPTCGSGSLLLKAHDLAKSRTGHDLTIYGQEMDNATSALARMNMVLHDCPTAEIWPANSLSSPHFKDERNALRLKAFDYVVANPPFSQKNWTTALSDVDTLLSKLDQLIAKKRDLKQAAMQQLLTGRRRLPGFTEPWRERTLQSAVARLEAGVSVRSVEGDGGGSDCFVLKTSAVADGNFDASERKPVIPADRGRVRCPVRAGTFLVSRMNTPDLVGEVGFVDRDHPNSFLPDRLWAASVPKGAVSARWLSCVLSSSEYKLRLRDVATGTSGSMKNISKGAFLGISVKMPALDEQSAIAQVLSDMDAELVALEARRDKTRQLKQGMMQALLTGRIRLV